MAYFNGRKNFLVSVCEKVGSGIIEVDALPTENINKNAFYVVGGKYYKWMDNNDNLGTWVFKDELTIPDDMLGKTYYFGYSSTENDGGKLVDVTLNAIYFYEDTYRYMGYLGDEFDGEVYENVGWYNDTKTFKTIKITEEPTDQTFIAWLKENATKTNANQGWQEFSAGGIIEVDHLPTENINKNAFYVVDGRYYKWVESGIWVFKDELSIPYEMYAKTYYFSYSSNGVKFNAFHFIDDLAMHTIQYANDETVYCVYDDSRGWGSNNKLYKTIEIHEMPTDETFIAWLNDNATKDCCWVEYVTSSVSSGIVGTWVFNDDGLIPYEMYGKTYNFGYYSNDVKLNKFQFSDDGAIHSISYANDETGYYVEVYDDNRGWNISNESYKTIKITEEPTDQTFIAWLRENATKQASASESEYPQYNGKAFEGGAIKEDHENVYFRAKIDEPIVVRDYFDTRVSLRSFGNAVASDVRKGKLFTSIDGYQTEGTYEGNIIEGDIIEVDELPTENIDENAFYLVGGKYYRWEKNGTWVFKDNYLIPNEMLGKSYRGGFSVNTPSDGVQTMDRIALGHGQVIGFGRERDLYYIEVAELGYWYNDIYKTITITEMPTDATFIAWLKENATGGTWSKYVPVLLDDDIIGTWVFDDKISIPDNFYGNDYHFRYSVHNIPDVGDVEFTALRFYDDGIKYMEYVTVDDGSETVYQKGVGWFSDCTAYQTIDIHEVPDDEAFINWLRMNATKQESEGDILELGDDEPLPTKRIKTNKLYLKDGKYYKYNETNVLVFKDELGANGAEELMSKDYKFEYSVNVPNVGKVTMNEMVFRFDGTHLCISYYGDEYSIDDVYDEQIGWRDESLKTIEFHEMPDDEAFTNWLFEVAMSVGSWTEYADTTSNAPIASETWVFNEELTNIDKPFENGYEDVACSGYMLYDKVDEPFNFRFTSIRFEVDRENGSTLSVYLRNSDTNGIGIYYIDNFTYNFRHGTITFTELPDDEVFLAWLKENATKEESVVGTWVFNDELKKIGNEGGLYLHFDFLAYNPDVDTFVRMNEILIGDFDEESDYVVGVSYYGEEYSMDDVYDGLEWMDEKYKTIKILTEPTDQTFISWLKANATKQVSAGAITEIQTPEELDSILANATSSDVGKAYIFVGESNGKYKNNSIYIIREV